jgi:murein DD-endopeptidase MepM/ murein hydrolase activator NlpD
MHQVPIERGDTFDGLLSEAGIAQAERLQIIKSLAGTFDVRKFRAGTRLAMLRADSGELQRLEYAAGTEKQLRIERASSGFEAALSDVPGELIKAPVCTTLRGSLFESVERVGEKPELAIAMAEIFAWDIDFYRDPRAGDQFCLLVEKKQHLHGAPATYGRILAATYINGKTAYDGFLFSDDGGKPAYYASDGRSLQSAFLRSPLKFDARVSSHFSMSRLHPVLHTVRAHLGTDYAAPTGTPVYSVASGKVVTSAFSGGSGNLVTVRHANGYETSYLHLSERSVRAGEQVAQGDRVGLVGSTGLATGPHLDFRVNKNGQFVNFESMKVPPSTHVSAANAKVFAAERDNALALLRSGQKPSTALLSD